MNKRRLSRGFTLIEIMIVVAIIALLAAVAVPSATRARKRGQAAGVLADARLLNAAQEQFYTEYPDKIAGSTFGDQRVYVDKAAALYSRIVGTEAYDQMGNLFTGYVDTPGGPMVTISSTTFAALSDVAPSEYWEEYWNPAHAR